MPNDEMLPRYRARRTFCFCTVTEWLPFLFHCVYFGISSKYSYCVFDKTTKWCKLPFHWYDKNRQAHKKSKDKPCGLFVPSAISRLRTPEEHGWGWEPLSCTTEGVFCRLAARAAGIEYGSATGVVEVDEPAEAGAEPIPSKFNFLLAFSGTGCACCGVHGST